jgi:class 3 adenylate cyclase
MNINKFGLSIYFIYLIKNIIYYNATNNYSILLALIYIKYTLNILLQNNMTLYEYEFNRNIMWLFATPLMIKMYCNVNNLKLRESYIQYHIIPVIINIFIYPYYNTKIYYYFIGFSWILLLIFMKSLYEKRSLLFTNVYLFIWTIFMLLNIIDLLNITNKYEVTLYYSFADMLSKIMASIIINDYNERELMQINNMDLQSVQFITYLIKYIKKYRNENAIITTQSNKFIDSTIKQLSIKIPENKTILEQELLKKILPLDLDKAYIANANIANANIDANTDANTNTNTNANTNAKQFNMICILFSDIVNYTELAKKYNDKIIFQLLYSIYTSFDNIIKKYPHLQKIETIGDAYMVVGDIFRDNMNHKIVIKELILFAFDIIKEIKTIKTPDDKQLSIRIGINMGAISVGILGNEIPRLCVVGNAVNVASRLQSTAEIDTIQLSRHIYEQLEEIDFDVKFEITKKENVFLKNIGSVTTYNISPN